MKNSKRTDCHRPGAIIPSDYEEVLIEGWGYVAYIQGRQGEPPFGVRETVNFLMAERAKGRQVFGGIGKCGVCGAWFMEGVVLRHVPTGDYVHLGHMCAEKYEMLADCDWDAATSMVRRQRAAELTRIENERLKVWAWSEVDKVEGLRAALETNHHIVADIKARVDKGRVPSERQTALVFKLAKEAVERVPEVYATAPTGRVTVRGVVVSTRTDEGPWGTAQKMVVKVTEADGSIWLVWSTAPQSIYDSLHTTFGHGEPLKGKEVEFTATLSPGKDKHFAFCKRPTKGRVVTTPAVAEAS
jgi:hypothetical protein